VSSTVTVTGRFALPPGPVQVNVKVLVCARGPTSSLPDVGFSPAQALPARHEAALVDDQVRVE
jgi:hypothetical protein